MTRLYTRGRPTELTQLVGKVVRDMRYASGLTQQQLADLAGSSSKQHLSDFETKCRSHVTIAQLELWADALGVPVHEVLRLAAERRCAVHEAPPSTPVETPSAAGKVGRGRHAQIVRAAVRSSLLAGMSLSAVARKHGVPRSTVGRMRAKLPQIAEAAE